MKEHNKTSVTSIIEKTMQMKSQFNRVVAVDTLSTQVVYFITFRLLLQFMELLLYGITTQITSDSSLDIILSNKLGTHKMVSIPHLRKSLL